jgi:hypothetical protein
VKQVFARYEFQSGKGCGNLPHIHMGLVLEDEDLENTRWRVSCNEQNMFYCTGRGNMGEHHKSISKNVTVCVQNTAVIVVSGDHDFMLGTIVDCAIRNGYVRSRKEYWHLLTLFGKLHVSAVIFLENLLTL